MQKRGISSTVFVYALAMVIIALVLIFGLRAISQTKQAGQKVEVVHFINTIKNRVNENQFYGRKSFEEFRAPPGQQAIVFVAAQDVMGGNVLIDFPQAQDVAESPHNAFIVDDKGGITSFDVGPIMIDPNLPEKYGKAYRIDAAVFYFEDGEATIPMTGTGEVTCIGLNCKVVENMKCTPEAECNEEVDICCKYCMNDKNQRAAMLNEIIDYAADKVASGEYVVIAPVVGLSCDDICDVFGEGKECVGVGKYDVMDCTISVHHVFSRGDYPPGHPCFNQKVCVWDENAQAGHCGSTLMPSTAYCVDSTACTAEGIANPIYINSAYCYCG